MYLLGGLAALLAIWFMVQAAEGLGYAFPKHPSVIDPARARGGATMLLTLIIVGLAASVIVPLAMGQHLTLSVFHLAVGAVAILPIWEMMTVDVYKGSFVILNATEATRPAIVAAVDEVFGSVIEDKDMLLAADWEGDDFQLVVDERAHLMVLNPTFIVPATKVYLLMKALHAKLHEVKAPRFNERSFWFAFALPLGLTVLYGAIAYFLLNPATHPISLRGTLGAL